MYHLAQMKFGGIWYFGHVEFDVYVDSMCCLLFTQRNARFLEWSIIRNDQMLSCFLSPKPASLPKTQYCVSRRPLVRSHFFSLWRGLTELSDLTKPPRKRWPVDRADSTPQYTHISASSIWAVRIGHPGENIVLFLFHDNPIRLDKSCNVLAFLGSESHQFVRPL